MSATGASSSATVTTAATSAGSAPTATDTGAMAADSTLTSGGANDLAAGGNMTSTAPASSAERGSGGAAGAGEPSLPSTLGSSAAGGSGASAEQGSTGGTPPIDTDAAAGAGGVGSDVQTPNPECDSFSFFVTSQKRLFELAAAFNGSSEGFGGDLTYGETGAGAGLRGADKICTQIAEASCAGNGKTWRAFLSVSDDGAGSSVNAIDRVGPGPWYDRNGRLLALSPEDLQADRPLADAEIADDLPNEDGFGNHRPDGTEESLIDNHNVMTGSDELGHYAEAEEHSTTCNDWTDTSMGPEDEAIGPNIGESWWRVNEERSGIIGWIDSGHNAAGCAPGAINPDEDFGFGVGEGDINCGTVGCMGGYGGVYCFALAE